MTVGEEETRTRAVAAMRDALGSSVDAADAGAALDAALAVYTAAAEEEAEEFAEQQMGETLLHSMGPDADGQWVIRFQLASETAMRIVMALRTLLDSFDADNYVEQVIADRDDPTKRYVFIAARSRGQTPHKLLTQARAELVALRQQLAEQGDAEMRIAAALAEVDKAHAVTGLLPQLGGFGTALLLALHLDRVAAILGAEGMSERATQYAGEVLALPAGRDGADA